MEQEVIKSVRHSLICVPITGKEGVIVTIATFDKIRTAKTIVFPKRIATC